MTMPSSTSTRSAALADQITDVVDELYSSGFAQADDGQSLSISPTGMRRDQGELIGRLVEAAGATRTIETGFAFGLSGLFMLRGALRASAVGPEREVSHVAMDPFQDSNWGNAGVRAFERAGISNLLQLKRDRSEFALPELAHCGASFDVGLVDGDHRFDTTFVDVFYMRRVVRPGGLLIVDDTWLPSVQSVINFFLENGVLVSEEGIQRQINLPMAVLRVPDEPDSRGWDHFVPFECEPATRP